MIEARANTDYLVELCSGEQCRWRCLAARAGDKGRWWRDLGDGREFAENDLMYAWRIVAEIDPPNEGRAP